RSLPRRLFFLPRAPRRCSLSPCTPLFRSLRLWLTEPPISFHARGTTPCPCARKFSSTSRHFRSRIRPCRAAPHPSPYPKPTTSRSEEHTSELQSRQNLVCRLLLEKKTSED